MYLFTFSFKGKNKTGEHEDSDDHDDENETKIFVSLMKSVNQALESNKVTNHLEDAENTHNSKKYFQLPF